MNDLKPVSGELGNNLAFSLQSGAAPPACKALTFACACCLRQLRVQINCGFNPPNDRIETLSRPPKPSSPLHVRRSGDLSIWRWWMTAC